MSYRRRDSIISRRITLAPREVSCTKRTSFDDKVLKARRFHNTYTIPLTYEQK